MSRRRKLGFSISVLLAIGLTVAPKFLMDTRNVIHDIDRLHADVRTLLSQAGYTVELQQFRSLQYLSAQKEECSSIIGYASPDGLGVPVYTDQARKAGFGPVRFFYNDAVSEQFPRDGAVFAEFVQKLFLRIGFTKGVEPILFLSDNGQCDFSQMDWSSLKLWASFQTD